MFDEPCRFHWLVHHPTMTIRGLEAKFYSEYPILTQWRVSLCPEHRGDSRYVELRICLSCDGIEEGCIISAQNLLIQLTRGDALVIEEKMLPYDFRQENGHSYVFTTDFYDENQYPLSCLLISIEITFHKRSTRRRRRTEFKGHLKKLSEDFRAFFNYFPHSNLKLKSKDSNNIFHVHSYIMRARWNNFFGEPSLHTVSDNTIEIDISLQLLHQILIYMYCGKINIPVNDRRGLENMTELFQVIEFYRIHHLYRIFAKHNSGQVRKTFPAMLKIEFYMPLKITLPALNIVDAVCYRNRKPIHAYGGLFVASFKFQYPEGVCSVSYTLESHSPVGVFCRVHLGLQVEAAAARPFDEYSYIIGSGKTVYSGLLNVHCDMSQMNKIHCVISLTDCSEVIQVMHSHTPGQLPPSTSYEMLSDHMRELLNFQTDADLRVTCRSRNPHNPDVTHPIHNGILVARLPGWRNVIKGVFGGGPGEMESFAKSEAFEHILDYIYTGECPFFPLDLFSEMYAFAMAAYFWPLLIRLTTIYG